MLLVVSEQSPTFLVCCHPVPTFVAVILLLSIEYMPNKISSITFCFVLYAFYKTSQYFGKMGFYICTLVEITAQFYDPLSTALTLRAKSVHTNAAIKDDSDSDVCTLKSCQFMPLMLLHTDLCIRCQPSTG